MAKKQQIMGPMMGQQPRGKQPRGGGIESMLIQGESGLSETMANNFQLVSNPMMQTIGSIMAKDAARGNALQKNLAKGNETIDTETGEIVRSISDPKVRDQIINYSRGLKSIFAQSGGQNMDIINGEIGDLAKTLTDLKTLKVALQNHTTLQVQTRLLLVIMLEFMVVITNLFVIIIKQKS